MLGLPLCLGAAAAVTSSTGAGASSTIGGSSSCGTSDSKDTDILVLLQTLFQTRGVALKMIENDT